MTGQRKSGPKGRRTPVPPWAEEAPKGARGLCVSAHGNQKTHPLGGYLAYENTQGQKLEKPLSLCSPCLTRMEKARQRHDEHAGSVRQRNLDAQALTRALEVFVSTTGVDLKGYVNLAEGRFYLEAQDVEELAAALDGAYEGRAAEGLPEMSLMQVARKEDVGQPMGAPAWKAFGIRPEDKDKVDVTRTAEVLKFARRVPGA